MAVALRYSARSDVGLLRKSNQDSGYAGPHLVVVADGMGGAAGGDIASSVVVAHLAPLDDEAHTGDLLARLKDAVYAAHDELIERVSENPALAGLGTTVVALLRSGNRFAMIHIGDSRAYLLRDGEMLQVTTDHTFVQHLVEAGRITAEEAEHHPQRSVLLRVLGDNASDIVLDEWIHEARIGDRWLLCSDGLSGVVSAETIEQMLIDVADPGECADALVALALRGGGPDNVTVVVADVVDLDRLPDGAAPTLHPEVVGAAAADRRRPTRGGSGAAGRAAAIGSGSNPATATEGSEDDGAPSRRLRRRWIWLIGVLVLVAVLIGVALGAYRWSQNQYYIGVDDGYLAIFRGIPQELGPIELSSVETRSDVRLVDLPPFQRERLEQPITNLTLADAQRRLTTLEEEAVLPEPEPTPVPDGETVPPPPTATPGAEP